jgi:hypothetical protein
MVDGIKDRLEKNERIVMNGGSRPLNEDIKQLAELFAFMYTVRKIGKIRVI